MWPLTSGHLLCVLQVVFSEAWWVGDKLENPEERRLPMPPELQLTKIHNEDECELPGA